MGENAIKWYEKKFKFFSFKIRFKPFWIVSSPKQFQKNFILIGHNCVYVFFAHSVDGELCTDSVLLFSNDWFHQGRGHSKWPHFLLQVHTLVFFLLIPQEPHVGSPHFNIKFFAKVYISALKLTKMSIVSVMTTLLSKSSSSANMSQFSDNISFNNLNSAIIARYYTCPQSNWRGKILYTLLIIISPGTRLIEWLWTHSKGKLRQFALLVSLTMYIELEGRMIPQNDTLDESDRPSYRKKWVQKIAIFG